MAQQTFAYTALDTAGVRKSGAVDAETREAAVARLASEGRFVLDIREASQNGAAPAAPAASRRAPSRQDLALFTRRLADMASAGLPLDRVLSVVAEQSESAVLSRVAEEALVDVRGGMPVSQALAKHPKFFNEIFTQTIRAGEASGQFGEVAGRLADYQEKEVTRRGQIVSALVYPAVLAFAAAGVLIFLFIFVLPRLSPVFKKMGNDLPLSTVLLLASSDFVTHNWIAIIVGLVGLIVLLKIWFSTPSGAYTRDRMLLRLPAVGPVVQKAIVSRFARVLGTLVYGGVPILEALEIAGLSASNRVFLKSSRAVEEEVRAGRPIAEAMRDVGAFPPVLMHMVAVGEETGDLPKMLGRVADSLDFEVDTGMRRLVSLVEPIIVLAMGSVVGFVVLSVLLPIYQSENLVH
ncbi:MAG TPA: type II secretion system F family protein [Capsulimonadaceae bacterium]|nr:type II secretion system F family protein [Capsulimonadaceae bacterium]